MLEREGTLLLNNLIDTNVSVEVGLDFGEGHDRAISATAAVDLLET